MFIFFSGFRAGHSSEISEDDWGAPGALGQGFSLVSSGVTHHQPTTRTPAFSTVDLILVGGGWSHGNLPGRHFLAATCFVSGYVIWEFRIVYKLTNSEALGIGVATVVVILLCLLLLSKACPHPVVIPLTISIETVARRGVDLHDFNSFNPQPQAKMPSLRPSTATVGAARRTFDVQKQAIPR